MKSKATLKNILLSQRLIALSTLAVLFVFFSIFGKNFLTQNSMVSLLESTYYIICLAFGMTFVISTGGIDLSIGCVAMCGALIGGVAYDEWGMPIGVALIVTILVATCFGVINGFLIAYCHIPPFVATMGTQYLAQGFGYIVSQVQTMRYPIITSEDGWFKRVFYKSLEGFPMGVLYMVLLFVIAFFLFRYTQLGKYACAIGSNCEATRLSGVNTKHWILLVYIIAGIFAGLAGVFLQRNIYLGAAWIGKWYGNECNCCSGDRWHLACRRHGNDVGNNHWCFYNGGAKKWIAYHWDSATMAGVIYRSGGIAGGYAGYLPRHESEAQLKPN